MTELELDVDGPAAPPRDNGELVFAHPWESRVFGLTAALVEQERVSWPDMQQALIRQIAAAEAVGTSDYWSSWLAALGEVCRSHRLVTPEAIENRTRELAARPSGHDH